MRVLLKALAVAAVAVAPPALAGTGARRHLQLAYERLGGADRCPTREALAADVAAYLGYDPFSVAAEELLSIKVEGARAGGLTATLELTGPTGALEGRQELTSQAPDCRQLSESLSLAISLAIDPLAPGPQMPAAAPSAVVQNPAAVPPAPADKRLPTVFAIGVAPIGTIGFAPAPAFGALIDLEMRRGHYSLGLEGQASLNAGITYDGGGSVAAQLLAGSLVPCAHVAIFGGCLLVAAGAEQGSATGIFGAHNNTTPFLGVGARAFIEILLGSHFLLRPAVEVDVPLIQTTLEVAGVGVWTTSAVAAALSLTALVLLP